MKRKKNYERWYYTAEQVAPITGWDAQYIRIMARTAPDDLPFKTEVRYSLKGNKPGKPGRVYVRKDSFREWCMARFGNLNAADELDRQELERLDKGA